MVRVRWFLAYRFLAACLPYLPVASLCLSARGLGWDQVLQLGALYAIASAALILPVSALAQRLGTRRTLIGGAVAVAIGAVLAAIARDVTTLAIAQIAFAIAAAVDAGADSAYLWSLLGSDREVYRRAEAHGAAVKLAGGVVGIGLGGALLAWSPVAPFAAAAGFALAAAACATRLAEVAPAAATPARRWSVADGARALVVAAGGARWLVIAVVSCAVARVLASAIGPLLVDAGLTTASATALATTAAVIAAAAAALTGALRPASRRIALFVAAPAALAAIALALAAAHGAAAMALVAALPVLAAVIGPLWRAHLNQHAPARAPRLLVLAIDATLVRVVAAALPLAVTSGAGPRAAVAALGVVLLGVIGAVAAAIVLRGRPARARALGLG
jgi:MFS family permease